MIGMTWRLIEDEKPEYGRGTYVIASKRGRLWLVYSFRPIGDEEYFSEYKNGFGLVNVEEVVAWMELPPMSWTDAKGK